MICISPILNTPSPIFKVTQLHLYAEHYTACLPPSFYIPCPYILSVFSNESFQNLAWQFHLLLPPEF